MTDRLSWNKMTPAVRSWLALLLTLPVAQASNKEQSSTTTVVLLFLLLMVLCIGLVLAWKRLIHTDGGEAYHPWELWQRAQEKVQDVKTRWTNEDEEGTTEDDRDDEDDEEEGCEVHGEEPDITAL